MAKYKHVPEEQRQPPPPRQPDTVLDAIRRLAEHLNVGNVMPNIAGVDWSQYLPAVPGVRDITPQAGGGGGGTNLSPPPATVLDAIRGAAEDWADAMRAERPLAAAPTQKTYLPMVQGGGQPAVIPWSGPAMAQPGGGGGGTTLLPQPPQQIYLPMVQGGGSQQPTQSAQAPQQPTATETTQTPGGERRGPTTGWTDAESRAISLATVGRELGIDEIESWVSAFKREHGSYPWQTGPFDAHNNFLDHLMALGESEREVAMGMASPFTKAGREGNIYAQPAITPDFWSNAYYSRYAGPTYIESPYGPINMGRQPLLPGQMPGTSWPAELAYYGSLPPRPYYQYMPAMSPDEWGTSTATDLSAPASAWSPYYASLYGYI